VCSVFAEAEYKSFSIGSKSASITDYTTTITSNGQTSLVVGQQLADLPAYKKNFNFADNFQQAVSGSVDLTQPRTLPTQKVNLSGIGINVGLVWRL
jgi:hypothetical protein